MRSFLVAMIATTLGVPAVAVGQESLPLSSPADYGYVWDDVSIESCTVDASSCTASETEAAAGGGITFNADLSQFYFGVAQGGREEAWTYGGHGDYVFNIDSEKLGGPKGLFVKVRAEHRFGETIQEATGAILPPTVLADLPTTETRNVYLTNVLFTQFLSETFGVFAGKLDTLDGDLNAFAHGRGKTQFSNAAFVATPVGLRTVVYSTLGTGFVILQEGEPLFSFSVLNATDTVRTSGFDELFADGVVLVPELRLPTKLGGRPGHFLIGGSWSSRDYVALDQAATVLLPNVPVTRRSDSWAIYCNFDQYLWVDPRDPSRGWGVFGRSGIADEDTNPIERFLSLGIGGNSLIRGRNADTFGVGWYYAWTSSELLPALNTALGGVVGDGQGVEIFYNAEITSRLRLTADMQILDPALNTADESLLLGLRAVFSI